LIPALARPARRFLFSGAAVLLAGCSIFTSLSGLSGGADPAATDGGDGGDLDGPTALHDAEAGDSTAGGDGSSGDGATKVVRIYVFGGTTDTQTVATVLHADVFADGTLASWETDTPLPDRRQYAEAAVGVGFVAVVGGAGTSGDKTSTFIAKIRPDGLGDWAELGSFGAARVRHAAVIQNDRLYVMGGTDSVDTALADVQFAPISAVTVGTFTATAPVPTARSRFAAVATKTMLYVLGGSDPASNPIAQVSSAMIKSDGTLTTFVAQPSLPSARTHEQATLVGTSHILVTGGEGSSESVVYDIDGTTGSLSAPRQTLALPAPVDHHATVIWANHVYVIGGFRNVSARLSDVLVGDLAADGTVTRWTPTTSLPVALAYHTAAVF
jgi:hypothetical protein